MPDDAAAQGNAQADTAEEASAFSHPAVPPDATASYGDHPDQVIDFYTPRDGDGDGENEGAGENEAKNEGKGEGENEAAGASRTAGGFNPVPDGPAPLVVLLHGGAWRPVHDRRHLSPFADFLVRRGFAVANVEYRRGRTIPPQGEGPVAGRWPDTFDDVAAALDALPGLARTLLPGADVRRTVVVGHSAGGHLALWASARHLLPEDAPWHLGAPPALRAVVALAPIADFSVARKLDVCSGAAEQFLGGPGQFADRLPYADPVALLPTGIATTLVQGRRDTTVPQQVAEAYADAAARAGEVVGLTLLEDVGHFPLIDPAADACAVVAEEIAQLAW